MIAALPLPPPPAPHHQPPASPMKENMYSDIQKVHHETREKHFLQALNDSPERSFGPIIWVNFHEQECNQRIILHFKELIKEYFFEDLNVL